MAYTRDTIIKKIIKEPLYNEACVNYTGVTTDTKEKYTEVIASYLLEYPDFCESNIRPVTRSGTYKVPTHKWHPCDPSAKRKEEHIARSLYGETISHLKILDYQVPLKNKGTVENKGLGKIDLLAHDGEDLIILELKRPESKETLLRCILEIYAYWLIVNHKKLKEDFDYSDSIELKKGVLVFENSQPYKDYHECEAVRELMKKLDVDFFVLSDDFKTLIPQ